MDDGTSTVKCLRSSHPDVWVLTEHSIYCDTNLCSCPDSDIHLILQALSVMFKFDECAAKTQSCSNCLVQQTTTVFRQRLRVNNTAPASRRYWGHGYNPPYETHRRTYIPVKLPNILGAIAYFSLDLMFICWRYKCIVLQRQSPTDISKPYIFCHEYVCQQYGHLADYRNTFTIRSLL
jgi:hypothetical protein